MVMMQAIIQRTMKFMEERDEQLAIRIANAVGKAFTGKG